MAKYPEAAEAGRIAKAWTLEMLRKEQIQVTPELMAKAIRSSGYRASLGKSRETLVSDLAYRTAYFSVRNGKDPAGAVVDILKA